MTAVPEREYHHRGQGHRRASWSPAAVDVDNVAARLEALGSLHWWLRPVAFVGVAMLGLADAVVTIVRNRHLMVLAALPAVWLGAISWQWRQAVLSNDDLPVVSGWAAVGAAAVVVSATCASYWCNVTFALTVHHHGAGAIHDAFTDARQHAKWIWAAAGATAAMHVTVVVWVVRSGTTWFALGLGAVTVLQMYAFVAVPVLIATGRLARRPMHDRVRSAAASLGISGITTTPGVLVNRTGVLLLGLGWLRWPGMGLIAIGTVLQVAGISSATAVKFAGRINAATASASGSV